MIETWSLLFILAEEPKNKVFLVQDGDLQEELAEGIEECHEEVESAYRNVKDLRTSMSGLEFFMKDRFLKDEFCSNIEWEQPSIDIYKDEPKSYLPEECQKVLDESEPID
jgi:hypothetical protein